MPRDLAGTVIAITGGASGIGLACAQEAAERGARVAVIDICGSAARTAAKKLPDGDSHLGVQADVTDEHAMRAAAARVHGELGPVSGLVTCAGQASRGGIDTVSEQQLAATFAVNVFGVVHTVHAFLSDLRAQSSAAIVTIASLSAYRGGGLIGGTAYASAKAAVVGLTRALARELAPEQIRVNAVAPGPIDTPMLMPGDAGDRQALSDATLLKRVGEPHEVARAVLFLLSGQSSYMTGQVMHVNGGAHLG